MFETVPGSEDGLTTRVYMAGRTYSMEVSLSRVFVDEMHAATYEDAPQALPIETQPAIVETPEGHILSGPPKTWKGITLRQKETGIKMKVAKIMAFGRIQLSNGEILPYQKVRKEWEMIDGD